MTVQAQASSLVRTAPGTLLALRATLLTRPDLNTVFALRDAGYAGGDAVYAEFADFVQEHDGIDPQKMDVGRFFRRAGEFLTRSGWGTASLAAMDDTFCVVEIDGCWEADPANQPEPCGCHLTVGMLGAFLGNFAEYPVSVLEVEGPGTGSTKCRFLAGNIEMVAAYHTGSIAASPAPSDRREP